MFTLASLLFSIEWCVWVSGHLTEMVRVNVYTSLKQGCVKLL